MRLNWKGVRWAMWDDAGGSARDQEIQGGGLGDTPPHCVHYLLRSFF